MTEQPLADAPTEGVHIEPKSVGKIRPRDLLVRFAFGALTSTVAGIVGLAFGARAGGLFLAFPAILLATVTLIEGEEGTRAAREDAHGAIVGAIALAGFAALGALLFARLPAALVLALATIAWTAIAVGGYHLLWSRRRGR